MGNTRWSTRPRPIEERFWEKVEKGPDCWEWIGGRTAPGMHGRTFVNGRKVIASRVSWELHYGPIPDGLFVLHHCDNPPCVRPDHLFLGTTRDNMRDASQKRRTGPQIRDWSVCRQGHALVGDNVRQYPGQRRRCRTCANEGAKRRHAALTLEERSERGKRAYAARAPLTLEQLARQAEAQRRYRARHKGRTPKAMQSAATRLDEAMG